MFFSQFSYFPENVKKYGKIDETSFTTSRTSGINGINRKFIPEVREPSENVVKIEENMGKCFPQDSFCEKFFSGLHPLYKQ